MTDESKKETTTELSLKKVGNGYTVTVDYRNEGKDKDGPFRDYECRVYVAAAAEEAVALIGFLAVLWDRGEVVKLPNDFKDVPLSAGVIEALEKQVQEMLGEE